MKWPRALWAELALVQFPPASPTHHFPIASWLSAVAGLPPWPRTGRDTTGGALWWIGLAALFEDEAVEALRLSAPAFSIAYAEQVAALPAPRWAFYRSRLSAGRACATGIAPRTHAQAVRREARYLEMCERVAVHIAVPWLPKLRDATRKFDAWAGAHYFRAVTRREPHAS